MGQLLRVGSAQVLVKGMGAGVLAGFPQGSEAQMPKSGTQAGLRVARGDPAVAGALCGPGPDLRSGATGTPRQQRGGQPHGAWLHAAEVGAGLALHDGLRWVLWVPVCLMHK